MEDREGQASADQRRGDPGGHDLRDLAPGHHVDSQADRAETDDGTHDRVGGGDGQAVAGGHEQQGRSSRQRPEHPVDHELAVFGDGAGFQDTVAHGFSDVAAHEKRAAELEDARHDHGLEDREGAGADAGAHGVGDVVGTDGPRHVEGQSTRDPYDRRGAPQERFHHTAANSIALEARQVPRREAPASRQPDPGERGRKSRFPVVGWAPPS